VNNPKKAFDGSGLGGTGIDARCQLDVAFQDPSNLFKAGHRIELVIKGQDSQSEDPIWYHLCNIKETRHTIYHNAEHKSYLLLPLIPSS
jgi:predicted acyl esterase